MNEILCEKQNLKILSVGSLFVLKTKYMYVLIIKIVPDNTISFSFLRKKPQHFVIWFKYIWYALCVHKKQIHFVCQILKCRQFSHPIIIHLYVNFNCKISNFCSLKNWLRHSTFFSLKKIRTFFKV